LKNIKFSSKLRRSLKMGTEGKKALGFAYDENKAYIYFGGKEISTNLFNVSEKDTFSAKYHSARMSEIFGQANYPFCVKVNTNPTKLEGYNFDFYELTPSTNNNQEVEEEVTESSLS